MEKLSGIKTPKDGRHPLAVFQDDIVVAKATGPEGSDPLPIIEAPEEVVRLYNKSEEAWAGFEKMGHFIRDGVIVCLPGQKDKVRECLARSLDSIVFSVQPMAVKPK